MREGKAAPVEKLSRRTFVGSLCASGVTATFAGAIGSFVGSSAAIGQEFAADSQTVEHWMDEWMKRDRIAVGSLHLSRFSDPIYFLTKPITWKPNPGQESFAAVTVPIGFVTDFASIPRIFWSILPPDGKYTYPAILHDYLYWTQTTSRDVADSILKFGMEDFSVGTVTSMAIYNAVRAFGGSAWNENARLKSLGEKRLLRRFPEEPTATWADWKKLSSNFE
jgi:hypothetical protein